MAKLIRFPSLVVLAVLLLSGIAIAADICGRPTLADALAPQVVLADPPPPPRDATLEAVELELGSRLIGVAPGEAHSVAKVLVEESRKAGFDPWYIVAVIEAESMYDADACSPAGARGLMQLMPTTFKSVSTHYRVSDPVENVRAGIAYLAKLYAAGFNFPNTVLLAYNGGPANALAYLKATWAKRDTATFPAEMKEYPSKVLTRYKRLRHAIGDEKPNVAKSWRLP
jgi:soluble lytic murein transglycosylase-like protein